MFYAIVFITNQQLRDIKLEKILNPDFIMEKYVHEGQFDYSAKIKNSSRHCDIYCCKTYKERSILGVTKWKTIRGAEVGLKTVKSILESKRASVKGNLNSRNVWSQNGYIPVVCNITDEWDEKINGQIKLEQLESERRVLALKKRLSSSKV